MISRLIQNSSIRTKILFLIAIPLLIISVISAVVLYGLNKRASFDTVLTQEIMTVTGELVHYLQLERGLSAAFLASDKTAVPTKLIEQRQKVETKRGVMLGLIENADLSLLHGNTRQFVELADEELRTLDSKRERVDNRSSTPKETVSFYTSLNIHLLETALAFEVLVHDTELAERAMALTYYQMAKDAYGIQRAIGAIGFSTGWTEELIHRMDLAVAQSKERMRVFHELSDELTVVMVDAMLESANYQDFAKVRSAILSGNPPANMDPTRWFELATTAIGSVKGAEDKILKELVADLGAYDAANQNAFYQTLIGLSAVLALMSIGAVLIARDITGGLTSVTQALEDIGAGQIDQEVSGGKRGDEVGSIARQAEILRDHALKKREADAHLERTMSEQQFVSDQIATAMKQLSNKVLAFRVDQPFPEDFASLRTDVNALAETLNAAMGTVREAALSVGEDSRTIAANMDDLSRRTETQAGALERSTEAMNEITASVGTSAKSAKQAEEITDNARSTVTECETIVRKTVGAMDEIRTSSNEISQITKVIEDIAFQTNLLALNAGVEAARAGEAGRGFAVVASEVQRLAQRCSDAVSQIDEITARSSSQVKNGSQLVSSAGKAMADVSNQVSEISDLVYSISQGLDAQATQLTEVNHAVNEMEQMTQSNVSMTEETSASASQLFRQASELNTMIGEFQLDGMAADTSGSADPVASEEDLSDEAFFANAQVA
ncbi:methyl-accepting chemotaxis protein [Phaeobacter sp.]|uniref:methyl-accepting chemotaxis protein n=1 Tax=Phaeobacter sp. TaxID=1902409 RepID=UPI0025D3F1D8|nr:methyl-accepting chemotaxis protein [Phaeobacter sp.]